METFRQLSGGQSFIKPPKYSSASLGFRQLGGGQSFIKPPKYSSASLGSSVTLIVLLFFLFAAISNAAGGTSTCPAPSGKCYDNILNIIMCEQGGTIFAVIMFVAISLAFLYMIGSVTEHVHFKVIAKDEFFHLFFTIILLISFAGILAFSCNVTDFFFKSSFTSIGATSCYTSGTTAVVASNCYLKKMKTEADSMAQYYIKGQLDSMMDSAFSISIAIPVLNAYTAVADCYLRVHSQQYESIVNMFIMPVLLSLNMQKMVLNFISDYIVLWVVPIAFLFRAFPPTRPMGNVLIALAIGLYIIVPFMYSFNLAMYDSVFTDCNTYGKVVCDFVIDGCTPGNAGSTCTNPSSFWNIAKMIPQAFFLPNLTIAVFITFMGAVNKALRVLG